MLYITKDLGKTFSLVTSHMVQYSWGDMDTGQEDYIYFTHWREKAKDQVGLTRWQQRVDFSVVGKRPGQRVTHVLRGGNKFVISHGYILVAKLKDAAKQSVNLMVSADGGRTFNKAKLPARLDEKSYYILDTSEDAVVLHVNHGHSVGTIYISNQEGDRFAFSLANNVRSRGLCAFEKVMNVNGIYLANVLQDFDEKTQTRIPSPSPPPTGGDTESLPSEPPSEDQGDLEDTSTESQADRAIRWLSVKPDGKRNIRQLRVDPQINSSARQLKATGKGVVRSVISFDMGGFWSYLAPPKKDSNNVEIDCPKESCALHLHDITEFQSFVPFYSYSNALGIIMGTGNIGTHLQTDQTVTNTYVSRDGGLTWAEAHKGTFIYEFGNHGGLLVMCDWARPTSEALYSWNEGKTWTSFTLPGAPIRVANILTEPDATSTNFILFGIRKLADRQEHVLIHIDFDALGQRLCRGITLANKPSSDYETWSPSDGGSTKDCLLGRQITYTRRKQDADCFNEKESVFPVLHEVCECTEEDYECELDFKRQIGSTECIVLPGVTFAEDPAVTRDCQTGKSFWVDMYRKVAGDECKNGWTPPRLMQQCPPKTAVGSSILMSLIAIIAACATAYYLLRSDRFKTWLQSFGTSSYSGVGSPGRFQDLHTLRGEQLAKENTDLEKWLSLPLKRLVDVVDIVLRSSA